MDFSQLSFVSQAVDGFDRRSDNQRQVLDIRSDHESSGAISIETVVEKIHATRARRSGLAINTFRVCLERTCAPRRRPVCVGDDTPYRGRPPDVAPALDDYHALRVAVRRRLLLLKKIDHAHDALELFMDDRRPRAWNQWPEVVYREPRTARFVGDLPHTWCGSDVLNAVRMMFHIERETDDALVLQAGVPESWISFQPVGFKDMPTYGGRVPCTIARTKVGSGQPIAHIAGSCPLPSGGIRLTSPLGSVTRTTVNGKAAEIDGDGRVVVREFPAKVELHVAPSAKAD